MSRQITITVSEAAARNVAIGGGSTEVREAFKEALKPPYVLKFTALSLNDREFLESLRKSYWLARKNGRHRTAERLASVAECVGFGEWVVDFLAVKV